MSLFKKLKDKDKSKDKEKEKDKEVSSGGKAALLKELRAASPGLSVAFMEELKQKTEAIRVMNLEIDEWDEPEPTPQPKPVSSLPPKKEDLKEVAMRMNPRREKDKKGFWASLLGRKDKQTKSSMGPPATPVKGLSKSSDKAIKPITGRASLSTPTKDIQHVRTGSLATPLAGMKTSRSTDAVSAHRINPSPLKSAPSEATIPVRLATSAETPGSSVFRPGHRRQGSEPNKAATIDHKVSSHEEPIKSLSQMESRAEDVTPTRGRSSSVSGSSKASISTRPLALKASSSSEDLAIEPAKAPLTSSTESPKADSLPKLPTSPPKEKLDKKKSKRFSAPSNDPEKKKTLASKKWGTSREDIAAIVNSETDALAPLNGEKDGKKKDKKDDKKKDKKGKTSATPTPSGSAAPTPSQTPAGSAAPTPDNSPPTSPRRGNFKAPAAKRPEDAEEPKPTPDPKDIDLASLRSKSDPSIKTNSIAKSAELPVPSLQVSASETGFASAPVRPTPHSRSQSPNPGGNLGASVDVGPGKTVEIIRKLGKGATATVWEGLLSGRPIAVKQIILGAYINVWAQDMNKDKKNQTRNQIKKEFDLIKPLRNENIIRYHGMFFSRATQEISIVMELVDGPAVTDVVICQKKLSEPWAAHILRQAVTGLVFLHERSVIHRDFKPDNMLIDSSLTIKLIDFGVSAKIENDEHIKRRSTVGTPWYCAPEVVNSDAYGTPADIWSVGCTLIELVTGKPPWDDLNDIACLFKVSEGHPPAIPSGLSPQCTDFLTKCLQVDQSKRPTSHQLLEHPFLNDFSSEAHFTATKEMHLLIGQMNEERRRAPPE